MQRCNMFYRIESNDVAYKNLIIALCFSIVKIYRATIIE